jgi:hypothetical protein
VLRKWRVPARFDRGRLWRNAEAEERIGQESLIESRLSLPKKATRSGKRPTTKWFREAITAIRGRHIKL